MVLKVGKDPHIVWDGSTKINSDDVVMNDILPLAQEAPISYGREKEKFCQQICNLRASFPDADIDLASADVKAAHRYPRFNPDIAAAFGFFIMGLYFFVPTAMVFGAAVSATLWEPFRRAIEVMTGVYLFQKDLVAKHRAFLDMISLDPPASDTSAFTNAKACPVNSGVHTPGGQLKPYPNYIFVDDCLLDSLRTHPHALSRVC